MDADALAAACDVALAHLEEHARLIGARHAAAAFVEADKAELVLATELSALLERAATSALRRKADQAHVDGLVMAAAQARGRAAHMESRLRAKELASRDRFNARHDHALKARTDELRARAEKRATAERAASLRALAASLRSSGRESAAADTEKAAALLEAMHAKVVQLESFSASPPSFKEGLDPGTNADTLRVGMRRADAYAAEAAGLAAAGDPAAARQATIAAAEAEQDAWREVFNEDVDFAVDAAAAAVPRGGFIFTSNPGRCTPRGTSAGAAPKPPPRSFWQRVRGVMSIVGLSAPTPPPVAAAATGGQRFGVTASGKQIVARAGPAKVPKPVPDNAPNTAKLAAQQAAQMESQAAALLAVGDVVSAARAQREAKVLRAESRKELRAWQAERKLVPLDAPEHCHAFLREARLQDVLAEEAGKIGEFEAAQEARDAARLARAEARGAVSEWREEREAAGDPVTQADGIALPIDETTDEEAENGDRVECLQERASPRGMLASELSDDGCGPPGSDAEPEDGFPGSDAEPEENGTDSRPLPSEAVPAGLGSPKPAAKAGKGMITVVGWMSRVKQQREAVRMRKAEELRVKHLEKLQKGAAEKMYLQYKRLQETRCQVAEGELHAVEAEFEKAVPILRAARAAVENIKRGSISVLKTFKNKPPDAMKHVVCSMAAIIGEKDDWDNALAALLQASFVTTLKSIKPEELDNEPVERAKEKLQGTTPEMARQQSSACGDLCEWLVAVISYRELQRRLEPLREHLRTARELALDAAQKLGKEIAVKRFEKRTRKKKALKRKLESAARLAHSPRVKDAGAGLDAPAQPPGVVPDRAP